MLKNKTKIEVQFSEVDSLRVVWHGHYLRYFEMGREAFGREYGLTYMQVYDKGFFLPVVKAHCDYKRPIEYEDPLMIETTFEDSPAAKIRFSFKLYNEKTKLEYACGYSEQVFLDDKRELYMTIPPFFAEWKKKQGISNK